MAQVTRQQLSSRSSSTQLLKKLPSQTATCSSSLFIANSHLPFQNNKVLLRTPAGTRDPAALSAEQLGRMQAGAMREARLRAQPGGGLAGSPSPELVVCAAQLLWPGQLLPAVL